MNANIQTFDLSGKISLEDVRKTLLEASTEAAKKTLPLFRTDLAVDNKYSQGFDPVTQADRGAEEIIREVIAKYFPDHTIIGEEWDNKHTDSPFSWIIDPVDGTRAFVSGLPVWGTLIGVTYEGRAFAGLMSQPFTDETYLAIEGQSTLTHAGETAQLKVRQTTRLSEATLFTTTPALFSKPGQKQAFDAVEAKTRLTRYGCDCYAYALLAAGHIDLVIEPGMNTYDIAALISIIENAGGLVTTWDGGRPEDGGNIIAAATPQLRDEAMEIMNKYLPG